MTPEAAPPPRKQHRFTPVPATGLKTRVTAFLIAWAIRLYSLLMRVRIEDKTGITEMPPGVIWAVWHNRLLLLPVLRRRRARERRICVLTSPSRDGAMLAAIMKHFDMEAVRGSSNKRAAQALVECRRRLLDGSDLAITPDGPRGPVYVAAPGTVQLARITGRPILPVQVEYSRKWRLRSWDRFQIPRPFARITVTVLPPLHCGGAEIAEECRMLERLLSNGTEEGHCP
jgi:lysophospholipid acyltransferase (LPLAT)-like uncharacterized protein